MSSFLPSILPASQSKSPSLGNRLVMESLNMGTLTKSSFSPSVLSTAKFSSYSGRHVHSPKCKKRWNNVEEKRSKPMISQRHILSRNRVGFENHFEPEETQLKNQKTFQEKLDAFYRFTRPHIFISRIWITISVSLLAVEKYSDITPRFLILVFLAITAAWFLHIYIVGLNQLTDIEIDKVNKPNRPLITGEYSIKKGVIIISLSAIMSLLLGFIIGSGPLLCSLFIGFAIGTVYSVNVPFLRWKRIPFAATICFLSLLVTWPLGNYLHVQTFVLGRPPLISKATIVAISFVSIFAVSLSQFKDIHDIEGDKLDGIQTLAVRYGAEKVFWICIGLLELAYLLVILVAWTSPNNWRKLLLVSSQITLASMVWSHAKSVDLENKEAIESFHGFMWKLVSVEFFLIHLMR